MHSIYVYKLEYIFFSLVYPCLRSLSTNAMAGVLCPKSLSNSKVQFVPFPSTYYKSPCCKGNAPPAPHPTGCCSSVVIPSHPSLQWLCFVPATRYSRVPDILETFRSVVWVLKARLSVLDVSTR